MSHQGHGGGSEVSGPATVVGTLSAEASHSPTQSLQNGGASVYANTAPGSRYDSRFDSGPGSYGSTGGTPAMYGKASGPRSTGPPSTAASIGTGARARGAQKRRALSTMPCNSFILQTALLSWLAICVPACLLCSTTLLSYTIAMRGSLPEQALTCVPPCMRSSRGHAGDAQHGRREPAGHAGPAAAPRRGRLRAAGAGAPHRPGVLWPRLQGCALHGMPLRLPTGRTVPGVSHAYVTRSPFQGVLAGRQACGAGRMGAGVAGACMRRGVEPTWLCHACRALARRERGGEGDLPRPARG